MNIVILGYNDTEKAQIIDQLEEYFEFVGIEVSIDLFNEIDKLALLLKSMKMEEFPEDDRVAFAHLYLATQTFFQLPVWEHMFYKSTDWSIDALYDQVFEELGLDYLWRDVIGLPLDVNEAAELVRQTVEGIENGNSDTPEAEDRTVVREDS